ncbi:MAG TPA: rubrerythrin family protein [Myxococcota bacterium]|nr:rubrerythrin family protein [Myxococcota bacterium]HNZ03879.1 rubrerythrin family protein [Myxococcota bacterium]HOD08153.1 rubrerythrin family protein [Myxococcota bacterium]HPB50366.1 rubrerythrin family protein [Myxococcota bacterium]HQP95280.1 rubrerythrin family protein [Myxococcota bacterium]
MGKTSDNLKEAFSGESQARNKYVAYARKAAIDGLPNVAKLFRAAADAEEVHAQRHWKALGMVRDTLQNLEDGLAGETYEVEQMYPGFLAQAEKEQEISAAHAFKGALEAEKIHMTLYADAIAKVRETGKDIGEFRVYTCEVCGYTHVGDPIDRCPVCGVAWSKFHEVE